ncbi:hypothetical protein OGZ01_31265 (plasmid) [Vibrio harveyi]|nr:hypothetical protein [Vibrio harveyi]
MKKDVLLRDFRLLLQEKVRDDGKQDIMLLYLGDEEKEEVTT